MSALEAIAFWSNLYNAVTLEVVLEHYPVQSIRDIRASGSDAEGRIGPWTMDRVTVEGRRLSLNAIEHDILRREFADPRIHYAINCASASCPNLPPRAWRADSLDLALDDAARSYINHERGIRILPSGQVEASSIFKWYAGDFGDREASILAHQAQYAQGPLADALTRRLLPRHVLFRKTDGFAGRSPYEPMLGAERTEAQAGEDSPEAPIFVGLLPDPFPLSSLREFYEHLLGAPLDRGNFRRQFQEIIAQGPVKALPIFERGVPHRAGQLFTFDRSAWGRFAAKA
jgi:hypothetical protein